MWLLLPEILKSMVSAKERAVDVKAFDVSNVTSGTGEILVHGVLTPEPNFFASFFGGGNTVYSDIIAALAIADANPEINEIVMRFNSPGGAVSGMLKTMAAIKATSKPVLAIVDDSAFSAAYALASQADRILAVNELASVGAIGTVVDAFVSEREISITNRASGDKRPDITTDEGKAVVQDRLDAVHNVVLKQIEEGRGGPVDFGKGRAFIASEAIERSLIDGTQTEEKSMNLKELQAKHPETFAEAVGVGVEQERDRVTAHMTFGVLSPQHNVIAARAIAEGKGLTATLQSEYMVATQSKKDIEARVADEEGIGAIEPGAGKDAEDIVADLVLKEMGVQG